MQVLIGFLVKVFFFCFLFFLEGINYIFLSISNIDHRSDMRKSNIGS